VEVVEEPEITTNFTVDGTGLEIGYGYFFKISEDDAEVAQLHLVLTAVDVQQNQAFTGESEAITITINAERASNLIGSYNLSSGSNDIGTASVGRYYQNLRFSQSASGVQGTYNRGVVNISRQGEEYIISLLLSTTFGPAEMKGTFRGILSEIDLTESEPVDEALFQGPNNLKYGEREVGLNHAYLVKRGNVSSGPREYRLYLSETEIAPDAATLTGRSDLVFFYVREAAVNNGGQFIFSASENDYLGQLYKQVDRGYYCKNMDFASNSADDDVPVDKGHLVIKEVGGEILVAFTGEANTGTETSVLYRGPLVRID
jgi:hypothetical protein